MLQIARWKIYLSMITCLIGLMFALPNVLSEKNRESLPSFMRQTINLGLELRGGSHLQLEVDMKAVQKERTQALAEEAKTLLRQKKWSYKNIFVLEDNTLYTGAMVVQVELNDHGLKNDFLTLFKKETNHKDDVFIQEGSDKRILIGYSEEGLASIKRRAVNQSIEVIRRRVDESGTKEPTIQPQGDDRIILQLPGVEDPAEVKRLLGKTAKMTFRLVDHRADHIQFDDKGRPNAAIPYGSEILTQTIKRDSTGGKDINIPLVVKKRVEVSGESLIDANPLKDQYGRPAVGLTFDAVGSKKFARMSVQHTKKRFAIVLDKDVIMAPSFNEPIPSGQGIITGDFTLQEAAELALILRSGALPAPLKVVEEKTVGPSLGADSIQSGQKATIFAVVLVALFMILNYSLFGAFANVALLFNLIFLFAALSLLQATLTLPGIAGIALTVGMAVDANVLIYERIKEEIRRGLKPSSAIDVGYRRALTTILDSNITTLIGSLVLFEFGSGPIRGFAVTLALGILISLFTALTLTRIIIVSWFKRRRIETLPI
jgi:preprotein translocase subunit SecD